MLKEIIDNVKEHEELLRVFHVLKVLNNNPCKDACITSLEAHTFRISKGSLLAGVLAEYKEFILNENK